MLRPGGEGDSCRGEGGPGEEVREFWRAPLLGGRSLGRLLHSPAPAYRHMCREQGGTSLSLDWPARTGGAARHHHWSIPAASELMHCKSTSSVFDLQSGGDLSGGEAGGAETGGDGAVGEGVEGGEDSAVDG